MGALLLAGAAAALVLLATNGDDGGTEVQVAKNASSAKEGQPADEPVQKRQEQEKAVDTGAAAASEPIGGEGSAPMATDQTGYASYSPSDPAYSYMAEIPEGGGWLAPTETYPTGGALLRTSIRGPGGQFVLIDRTPSEVPQLGGGFESSGVVSHPLYGTMIEYVISDSDLIPECDGSQCVDYLIEDGAGGGWGVLAGGPDLGVARQMAQQVALSISG